MYPKFDAADLIVEEFGEEVLVYDTKRHKAHCLNQAAWWILEHSDGETSPVVLADRLQGKLADMNENTVLLGWERLSAAHLLQANREWQPPVLNRRELLKRVGLVAALPVVTSILSPTPAAAASCIGANGAVACPPMAAGSTTNLASCCFSLCIKLPGTPDACCPSSFTSMTTTIFC